MSKDLFTPDNKRYCCGPNAERQKFAQNWIKVDEEITDRAREAGKHYINEVYQKTKLLPKVQINLGALTIVWVSSKHRISLHVNSNTEKKDNIVVDYSYYRLADVEEIIDLLNE